MLLAGDVYCCLYVTKVIFRSLAKGSFSVDIENTTGQGRSCYEEKNDGQRVSTTEDSTASESQKQFPYYHSLDGIILPLA